MDAVSLLALIERTGGVAIAAHPLRNDRPLSEHLIRNGLVHVVESFNGRNFEIENLRVGSWRKKYSFHEIGGSDAHSLEELGKVTTNFDLPIQSRSDLIFALKNGLCSPAVGLSECVESTAIPVSCR